MDLGAFGFVALLQDKRLARDAAPDVMDVLHNRFEMRSRIVGARDKDIVFLARLQRLLERGDRDKLFMDRAEEVETRAQLQLGLVRLDDSRDLHNVEVLGAHVVRRGHFGNVDV